MELWRVGEHKFLGLFLILVWSQDFMEEITAARQAISFLRTDLDTWVPNTCV